MKLNHFRISIVVFSIIFLSGFISLQSARAAEPYNLGVALSITGAGALYSKDGVDAIKLAVDEINKKGGFLGKHPIKLSIRDDQTKPDVGVRETKDLILRDSVKNYFISPEELKTIKVPTLLVGADLDIVVSQRSMKDIHENIPNCELITIPNAGHAAFLERMNEFLTILIGFVTKHS